MRRRLGLALVAVLVAASGGSAFAQECLQDHELSAGLCYPKCKDGFVGVGPVCWQKCAEGFTNIGLACLKPLHIARANTSKCPMLDKCGLFGKEKGCSTCPAGYKNDGCLCHQAPQLVGKKSYGRGVGKIPLTLTSPIGKKGTAIVVCVNNSASNHPSTWNSVLEAASVALMPQVVRYEKFRIIRNCNFADLVEALKFFKGMTTDVATLAHGDTNVLAIPSDATGQGWVSGWDIAALKELNLTLRAVFQLNCYGSTLNESWLKAGAKAVVGSKLINTRVVAFTSFFGAWLGGKSFQDAVAAINADAGPIAKLYAWGKSIFDKFGGACCGACQSSSCKTTQSLCDVAFKVSGDAARTQFCDYYAADHNAQVDSTFIAAGDASIRY
jgi:hypothetical protein